MRGGGIKGKTLVFTGRELTLDWKLNRYPEFNKHILLFVGLKILGTYGSVERIIFFLLKLNMI